MTTDTRLEDFLSAVTDALNRDANADIAAIARRYDLNERDIESVMRVVRQLRRVLVVVEPPDRFVSRLRVELTGTERTLVAQVRRLPPRVRVAAGAMALFTVLLLARRRLPAMDRTGEVNGVEAHTAT